MKKALVSALSFSLALFSNTAFAERENLDVSHFAQEDECWSGIAVAEMLEAYYRGEDWHNYSKRQSNLAKSDNNGGVKVRRKSSSRDNTCGIDGGVNTGEMLTILNHRLKPYGKHYRGGVWSLKGNPKQSVYFHQQVIESINQKDPFIFAGHSRYRDGSTKPLQHWYLIIGYKDVDANPNTLSAKDGYYLQDPSVGAGFDDLKTLGRKAKFVSHYDMVKHLAQRHNALYPIQQVNKSEPSED